MPFSFRLFSTTWIRRRSIVHLWLVCELLFAGGSSRLFAAPPEPLRFNRDVLPLLADHCLACHGVDSGKRAAGLRLDKRDAAIGVLDSGQRAIAPRDLANSEIWRRINSTDPETRMPPPEAGDALTSAQRDILKRWIEEGAEYEPHWAFVPVTRPPLPAQPTADHPVDRFVFARLAREGFTPAQEAHRATLVRRLSLDLIGLPPTPEDVDAFVADTSEDAYERLVERLLASPHFGERWARWWLDLAHYGDSDGYLQDFLRPVAWRYRQWVVEAFNEDLPLDEFTINQLAGDLLPNATVQQRMGTGFLRNTLSNREGGADLEEYRVNQVLDRTVTLGVTWLALTTGCAQCHDHKFDAITQREFYGLYAFFNNADEENLDAPLPHERIAWEAARDDYQRKRAALIAPLADSLAELQADWEKKILHTESHPNEDFAWDRTLELLGLQWGQNLGEGQLEGLNIIKTPRERRRPDQQDRLLDYFLASAPAEYTERFKALKVDALRSQLDALHKQLPPVTRAPGMASSPVRRPTHVFIRGEYLRRGDAVTAGTPAALPPCNSSGEPDRLALARWLVSGEHPLTARVAVNRLWQELFGRGLVATSDNFGVRGDRPSHPELLDWLASELVHQQWSIKAMLRQLVLSRTYRQSSAIRPELAARDPLNRWLGRQVRVRLSAEQVRDSALASSGLLDRKLGGPSVKPPQPESVSKEAYRNLWEPSPGGDRYRRGLYTFIQRTSPFAQFVTFDMPDTSRSCTRRERSNTPLQSLQLLNDPVFLEAGSALASVLVRDGGPSDQDRIRHGFLLVLAREPTDLESKRLLEYLQEQRRLFATDQEAAQPLVKQLPSQVEPAWAALASVLLNLDEFITRE